jgi:hypothetical protein
MTGLLLRDYNKVFGWQCQQYKGKVYVPLAILKQKKMTVVIR